jgi:hypothetical protein
MTDPRIVSEPRGDTEDATFVRDGLALFNVALTGDAYYSIIGMALLSLRSATRSK